MQVKHPRAPGKTAPRLPTLTRLWTGAPRGPGRAAPRSRAHEQLQDFSHDLRANVQSIAAAAAASLEQPDPAIQRAALQDIAAAAAALDLQLGTMLDSDGPAGPPVSAFELDHEVARTCQHLQPLARRRQKHVLLETSASACVTVESNRDAFVRILQNLIINAVRYAESTSILVEVSCTDALAVTVRNAASRLTTTESRALLVRRSRGHNAAGAADGRGLGLSISRRLARRLGGGVQVMAVDGEFVGLLRLPVRVVAVHPPKLDLGVCVHAPEPLVRAVFARQLRGAGLEVATAARAPTAICVIEPDGTERELLHADLLALGDPPALRALCGLLLRHARPPRTALVVDDNPVARARLLQLLGQLSFGEVTSVADVDTARQVLAVRRFDHVVLDAHLGGSSGLQLREELAGTDGPNRNSGVIVVSAAPDAAHAVAARPASAAELAALLDLHDTRLARVGPAAEPLDMSAELAAELAGELRTISQRLEAGDTNGLDNSLHTAAGVARIWQRPDLANLLEQARVHLPSDPAGAAALLGQALSVATAGD